MQWSTAASPSSAASRTPGPGPSWLACSRGRSPLAAPAPQPGEYGQPAYDQNPGGYDQPHYNEPNYDQGGYARHGHGQQGHDQQRDDPPQRVLGPGDFVEPWRPA